MIVDLKPQTSKPTFNQPQKRKFEGNNSDSNKKPKIDHNVSNGNGSGSGNRVRMGNLSFDLDGKDDEIKKFFEGCGTVTSVEMIQKHDGRFAGVAIVDFADSASAAKALELNETNFYDRQVKLSYSTEQKGGGRQRKPLSEKPEGCTTIFIANLDFYVSEEEVIEFFSDCGTVKECRWPKGDFTGIGWVEFYDGSAVDKAIQKAGQDFKGRQIRIDYAAARRART